MADAQNRTLPATPRKIQKARRDGQLARSRDLGHVAAVGVGAVLLAMLAPQLVEVLRRLMAAGLSFDSARLAEGDVMLQHLLHQGTRMLLLVLPIGAAVLVAALLAVKLCGGWNFTLAPLHPKFEKLDPVGGMRRMFSAQQLVETLKSCLLAGVLLVIGALYLRSHLGDFGALALQPLPQALATSGELMRDGVKLLLLALAAFALVDVPIQRWRLRDQLKMSFEEMKQEVKDVEGNVEVKGRIRARMRQIARRRMLAAVPEADLVVMNPTHYAVALKYDEATMAAPKVVAKGTDLLALRIRDIAAEHRVPVLQAPPLARALHAHTEVDQEIPARLFSAVAQVLAWVYQLRQAATAGQAARLAPPVPQVPPELDPQQGGSPSRSRRRSLT